MFRNSFRREERFRITAQFPDGRKKTVYPESVEGKEKSLAYCRERGLNVLECVKLYPFSTEKNQHNFELIHNIVMCDLYDVWNGEKKVSDKEYERLIDAKEKSEKYFCLPLPVAWLPYKEWAEAKEIAMAAELHRTSACIANGRFDVAWQND